MSSIYIPPCSGNRHLFTYQFIFGNNFNEAYLVKKALQSFYGLGPQSSTRIMARFHIHPTARVGTLGDKQVDDIAAELSTMKLESDLRRSLQDNISRLRDMGTYRGRRHAMQLPVRGQNTRTQVRYTPSAFLTTSANFTTRLQLLANSTVSYDADKPLAEYFCHMV